MSVNEIKWLIQSLRSAASDLNLIGIGTIAVGGILSLLAPDPWDKATGIAGLGSGSTNLADAALLNDYATWLQDYALGLAAQKGLSGDETLEFIAEHDYGSGEMSVRCAEGCSQKYVGSALMMSGFTILEGSRLFKDRPAIDKP